MNTIKVQKNQNNLRIELPKRKRYTQSASSKKLEVAPFVKNIEKEQLSQVLHNLKGQETNVNEKQASSSLRNRPPKESTSKPSSFEPTDKQG